MEGIKTISIQEKNYPQLLKKIKTAPRTLYFKGELIPEEKCFAIVGTRRYSFYGKQIALEIAGALADAGLTIVSGLAPGIDTFCHQAVVGKGRRTIAVLGTGIDEKTIYPRENLKLARKILELGGSLISEYPPGTYGSNFTFPQRNRIISGLSFGVLVIEAKKRSGALITADWARKQNRKIFAVPGSIYSLNAMGCHCLIKKGAKLVESAEDILKELCFSKIQGTIPVPFIYSEENKEESLVLSALKEESLYIDKIIEKTKLPAQKVSSVLTVLEIKNKVKNLGNNIYAISHS